MEIQIRKKYLACIGILLLTCCICFFCTSFTFATNHTLNYFVQDLFRNDACGDRSFPNGAMLNTGGERIFDKSYPSPQDLLNNYPWFGQYFFDSPGEPYCRINLNPFYGRNTKWVAYDGSAAGFYEYNISLHTKEITDPITYYSEEGFMIMVKRDGLYYPKGFFGYYSAP